MIEDHMGKPISAIKVFEISLEYLKGKFLELLNSKHKDYKEQDVHWIITVPAIWDEFAKQFMRRAAEQVNHSHMNV
jgi:long-subunit acyl-CoA synthetase (AMP-forming)